MKKIDLIIPCYNEERNLRHMIAEIDKHLSPLNYSYEFIFIDDGSTDETYQNLVALSRTRSDINILKLSRNFGKESALRAGLEYSTADAAIIIDSDLQHPPHLIPCMIYEWEQGANVVDAVKRQRQKETLLNKYMSLAFYKLMNSLTNMNLAGASDFKLLDKKAIDLLKTLNEKNRFFRGLSNWVGLRHCKIQFNVEDRKSGKSKWGFLSLLKLSLDAITAYTSKPLHIVTFLGLFALLFSFLLGIQTLYNKVQNHAVSGFTTVILITLMLSSIIMISIGIMGIYLSRIYDEVKNRPIFLLESIKKSANSNRDIDKHANDVIATASTLQG
jgi:polyisoprenyl-phosphate glycosyltransferase